MKLQLFVFQFGIYIIDVIRILKIAKGVLKMKEIFLPVIFSQFS